MQPNWIPRSLLIACSLMVVDAVADSPRITCFKLRSPGPNGYAIEQASDLCFGRLGNREGLWTACDRNGGQSAAKIYLLKPATLAAATAGDTVVADEEFIIGPPRQGWDTFRKTHEALGAAVLDDLQNRMARPNESDLQPLDLEAIAIAPAVQPPHEPRLFVVAEEPYSLVLELQVGQASGPTQANLVAAYRYFERDEDHGTDFNDGLEGLAYAGSPGRFWWAEEATRLHKPDAHPRLFFSDPRIGLGQLQGTTLQVDAAVSERLTQAVRQQKEGSQQTLNALCTTTDGQLLAVDRNGGWILQVDPSTQTARRWFNIYDVAGTSLRQVLADFPGPRRMPYVSIEGIALDDHGDLWLVDDPAMPEPFRASCLVRISGLDRLPASRPAETRPTRPPETSPAR
jgi:hypothetical protein